MDALPGDGAPKEPEAPAASADSWKAKKYDKVYARLKAAEEELAAARRSAPAPVEDPNAAPKVLDEAEVNRRAAAMASTAEFNRRCNEVAESAKKTYTDFPEKVKQAAYARLVEATLETGEAPRLLYELGSSPDEAARLLDLASQSPVKLGMELAKLAAKRGEPEPSKTPRPITPIGDRGRTNEEINPADANRADNLSTQTWIKRRQADIDKRRAAGERIW